MVNKKVLKDIYNQPIIDIKDFSLISIKNIYLLSL